LLSKTSVPPLVILDVQDAIDQPIWDGKNNPDYVKAIQALLKVWRSNGWSVIFIKHDEATPTSTYHTHGPWNDIKEDVFPLPSETVISKHHHSAFAGTHFDSVLRGLGAETFILTGVVVHNSMDATIRAGKPMGYRILVPRDATTAVPVVGISGDIRDAATVFDISSGILDGEYAEVTTTGHLLEQYT